MSAVSAESRFLTTDDGVRLHYLDYAGGDPALVIVPGITSPAATMEFLVPRLAGGRRVVILDARGRGRSDSPPSGSYTLTRYADDVAALITELGATRPVVLGHSMGARTAAAFGVRHPQLAGPLIIVDPPLTGPGRATYPIALEVFEQQLRDARAGATAEDMRERYPAWDFQELKVREQWLRTCDDVAVRESWQNFHVEEIFGYLRDVPAGSLFMYGEQSPVVPADALPEIRQTNPGLELVGIADAAHMIPWENTDGFVAAVTEYLDRV